MPANNDFKDDFRKFYWDIVEKNIKDEKEQETPRRSSDDYKYIPERQYLNRVGNKRGKNVYFVGDTKVKVKNGTNNNLNLQLLNLLSNPDYYNFNDNQNYFKNGPSVKQKINGQKVKIKPKSWFNRLKDRMLYGNQDEQEQTATPAATPETPAQQETTAQQTLDEQLDTSTSGTSAQNLTAGSTIDQGQSVEDLTKENDKVAQALYENVVNDVSTGYFAEKGGKMKRINYFVPEPNNKRMYQHGGLIEHRDGNDVWYTWEPIPPYSGKSDAYTAGYKLGDRVMWDRYRDANGFHSTMEDKALSPVFRLAGFSMHGLNRIRRFIKGAYDKYVPENVRLNIAVTQAPFMYPYKQMKKAILDPVYDYVTGYYDADFNHEYKPRFYWNEETKDDVMDKNGNPILVGDPIPPDAYKNGGKTK